MRDSDSSLYEIKPEEIQLFPEDRKPVQTIPFGNGRTNGVIFHDDCLKRMSDIPDQMIDFILCDPPYGTTSNKDDVPIPFDSLWEQYKRIIKPNGCIALFADGMFLADLMKSNEKWWRYNLVWDKVLTTGFLNARRMPLRRHEEICIFYNKPPTYNPQFTQGKPLHGKGTRYLTKKQVNNNYAEVKTIKDEREGSTEKYPSSILTFQKPHSSVAKHRTEKPVDLLEWLIKTYTNEGEIVLDNCMGSGSTCVAAVRTRRAFIGIEKDKDYYEVAKKRLEDENDLLAV